MSQNHTIEKILERDGKIDNYTCIQTRLTLRLAARINDLKKVGWQFLLKSTAMGIVSTSLKVPHLQSSLIY